MKEKKPAQLGVSHHKILVWFLQVAEVKDLAMQSLGIQRKKLVRCSFTSSNSNGEWVKFIRFILSLVLCLIHLQPKVLSHNRKTLTKYTNWKSSCWTPLCLLGMLLTWKSCPFFFLFFFFNKNYDKFTILKMPSLLIYETNEMTG